MKNNKDVIERIIEIDHEACEKLKEAASQHAAKLEKAKADSQELRNKVLSGAQHRVDKATEEAEKQLEEYKQNIYKKRDDEIAQMDEVFATHRTQIEEEAFARIIKRS